ncbi:hypothetical protein DYB30_010956 [Aphanomyces astaci]|uniref:Transposase Tc1-like domain-containing protein n=1 Tax=Aphanomyces astaci TaxID=112090 RepID=A0A397CNG9_APHAT|nr:hypothetical protein DYB30_010956 [Aphanomyces astaci]
MDSARARRELSDDNKLEVIHNLQCLLTFGKLPRGSIQATATRLGINRKTVSSIWNGFITQGSSPSKKAGRVGRKLHYTPDHVTQLVQAVPQEQRTTMRDISVATALSLGTICRNLKAGTLQRRSSRLKPMLTDANRAERVGFCRSHVRRIAATSLAEAAATVTAFGEKLDNVFLTFQAVMRLVLEHNGDNQFRLPHMNKAAMRRAGTLMANVICPVSLLQ